MEVEGYRRMSAFCLVDSINLEESITALTSFSQFGERLSITSYTDVVHCRFFAEPSGTAGTGEAGTGNIGSGDSGIRDAFLFPYGSAVLWGFSSADERAFLTQLLPCCEPISLGDGEVPSLDEELGDSEFMLYEAGSNGSGGSIGSIGSGVSLSNNLVSLSGGELGTPVEKLAVSFAFAQSAKLSVFEAALEATSEEVRPIPVQLAKTGRCKFSVNEVARLTGRVFLERNAVNLYSNILDTPAFFWEAEELEPIYSKVNSYLDVEDRVRILNNRLDIVNDLLDSLCSQLETRNAHRLEIIIIYLIALEIVLEVAKEVTLPALGGMGAWPRRLLMLGSRAVFKVPAA